jgi:uncharacterized protein YbjT (DUF2867 family)
MVATHDRTVTVFGGTGFLGRRIVRHLRSHGFPVRIASRHPDRGHRLFGPDDPRLQSVGANIHDERSVTDALTGAYGVANAVSLYVEHGEETFHSVHVEAAQRVAAQAQRAGVEQLVHVSGIGADPASPSRYIRKRGEGELAVRAAFGDALFVRATVLIEPVSADSLPKMGIFAEMAGDSWQFPPHVRQSGSPETKSNARKAGISGPFSRLKGSLSERRNAWLPWEGSNYYIRE